MGGGSVNPLPVQMAVHWVPEPRPAADQAEVLEYFQGVLAPPGGTPLKI